MTGATSALTAIALLVAAAWLANQSQEHAGASGMALQDRNNLATHEAVRRIVLTEAARRMFNSSLALGAIALFVAFCAGLVAGLAL